MDTEYLNRFEESCSRNCCVCVLTIMWTAPCWLRRTGQPLARSGTEYVADAVEQIRDYPVVSVAWEAYLGLGVAFCWDEDWEASAKALSVVLRRAGILTIWMNTSCAICSACRSTVKRPRHLEDIIRRCGQTTVD